MSENRKNKNFNKQQTTMVVICLGPVCIPIYALLPFLGAIFFRLKEWVLGWWNGTSGKPASGEYECVDGVCKLKPGSASKIASWPMDTKDVVTLESQEQWDKFMAEKDKLVVVDFTATWCGPCKEIFPVFEKLCKDKNAQSNRALFLKVDIDKFDTIAEEFHVAALPTFVVLHGGNKVDEVVGRQEAKLETMIENEVK